MIEVGNGPATVTLWRPVGPAELALVRESGWRAWPPRLPDQPIFYPVLNEPYAVKIARDWNVRASGAGYVTRFAVDAEFARRYPAQQAGGRTIRELWVPAEDLAEFNAHLVGPIEVVREFHGTGYEPLAERVAEAAAGRADPAEVVAMLSVAGARTWIGLDRALRTLWPYLSGSATPAGPGRDERLAALAAACSGDGREREAALTSLRGDDLALPLLVLRGADWVPQVRERARTVLGEALRSADGPALVAAAGVAAATGSWARGDVGAEAVAEALRRSPEALAVARVHRDLRVRRLAYRLWLEPGRARRDEVLRAALEEKDRTSRLLCVRWLVTDAVQDGDADALERLLDEGDATSGPEALSALIDLGHPEAAAPHLAHRSAAVRAIAQWSLRQTGRDPATYYRESLSATPCPPEGEHAGEHGAAPAPAGPSAPAPSPAGASAPASFPAGGAAPGRVRALVAGLGECGERRDVDVLLPYLRHPSPRTRAAAVRSVRRLGGPLEPIAELFTDPAPVVVRAVDRALRDEPGVIPPERLWTLLSDAPPHVRSAAYRALCAYDTWTRLHADLHLLKDPDLGPRAHADLLDWTATDAATTYQPPPPDLAPRLADLLDTAAPELDPDQTRELRWLLGLG